MTTVTINCAGANGGAFRVHRAQEDDPTRGTNLTPLCPSGEDSASRGAVTYCSTDRLVNCPHCLDALDGSR